MQVFSLISFMCFFWIFIIAMYNTFTVSKISIIIFAGCCISIFLLGKKVYNCLEKRCADNEVIFKRIWLLLWGISIIFMMYVAWNLRASIYSTWDYGRILNDAIQLAKTGDFESQAYYARYPNNLLLLFILEKIFWIINLAVPNISAEALQSCSIILSCIFTQLSIVFIYITIKRLWGNKKAYLSGSRRMDDPDKGQKAGSSFRAYRSRREE